MMKAWEKSWKVKEMPRTIFCFKSSCSFLRMSMAPRSDLLAVKRVVKNEKAKKAHSKKLFSLRSPMPDVFGRRTEAKVKMTKRMAWTTASVLVSTILRSEKASTASCSSSTSPLHHHTQQFPKTNGSLYESLSLGREEAARVRAHFNPGGKREPPPHSSGASSCYYYGNGSAPNSPRFQHHHHNQSESFSSLPPYVDDCTDER